MAVFATEAERFFQQLATDIEPGVASGKLCDEIASRLHIENWGKLGYASD